LIRQTRVSCEPIADSGAGQVGVPPARSAPLATVCVVEVRPACGHDLDAMVEVMFAEPSVEQRVFMPSIAGARRFSRVLWQRADLDDFVVADDGGDVVGFAWFSERGVSMWAGFRAAVTGLGWMGPIRLAARGWPRQLVEISMPDGIKLIELQVHPSRRGNGIGSALLAYVIAEAGHRPISLTTRSDNPARRLYERHGFAVTAERAHPTFERRTGTPGRVLMVRAA